MSILEFKEIAAKNGFVEDPLSFSENELELSDFVDYSKIDIDLKIYLSKLIICRNFSPITNNEFLSDHIWFLNNFLKEFKTDLVKPWLSNAIKESIEMIVNGEPFTSNIIGTTFMFGVIEYYCKYLLSWTTFQKDFFDKEYHRSYREMHLGAAINKIKKTKTFLAVDLNEIDKFCLLKLKESGFQEHRWIIAKMSEKLTIARNTMLHGENHSFTSGKYICMLYLLFHFHSIKAVLA